MSFRFPFTQAIVVGGTGQTGHRVIELLLASGGVRVAATSRAVKDGRPAGPLASTISADALKWGDHVAWHELDLEAETPKLREQLAALALTLAAEEPVALVFAAAFTNVDACESDPAFCERVNELNTIAVLDWGRRMKARLAFYSTDYVFDGGAGPYRETDSRRAICVYGRSKVAVEEWLETNAPDALIARTTGVYDYLPGSKNFLMQMLALWGDGKTTRIPSDQFANPVWAPELARATLELLARGARGIFHVAGATQLARVEFAREIARAFARDAALIAPVETAALGQKALRPLKGGLVCDKLQSELGWAPGGAVQVLQALRALAAQDVDKRA